MSRLTVGGEGWKTGTCNKDSDTCTLKTCNIGYVNPYKLNICIKQCYYVSNGSKYYCCNDDSWVDSCRDSEHSCRHCTEVGSANNMHNYNEGSMCYPCTTDAMWRIVYQNSYYNSDYLENTFCPRSYCSMWKKME